jgi:hypothetical protein
MYAKIKIKKYHTVGTVPKANNIVLSKDNLI